MRPEQKIQVMSLATDIVMKSIGNTGQFTQSQIVSKIDSTYKELLNIMKIG